MKCGCCGADYVVREPDPWEGRLDGYCTNCALTRCDAYPGACTGDNKADWELWAEEGDPFDRKSSEFCPWCSTRHHPDNECIQKVL